MTGANEVTGEGGRGPLPQEAILRREILRWNRQFNLVSRVSTPTTLDELLAQSRRAGDLVWRELSPMVPDPRSLGYVDIGSGGGLPALVWTPRFRDCGHLGPVWLVEPREKRAWFLERAVRALRLEGVTVVCARWGQARPPESVSLADDILISLKALKLTDAEVLSGLPSVGLVETTGRQPCPKVTIVQFLAPAESAPDSLAQIVDTAGEAWRCVTNANPSDSTVSLAMRTYQRA